MLDFLGERENFYKPAAQVMTLADKQKIQLFTSPTTFANVYYLLSKYENRNSAMEKLRKFKLLCPTSIIDDVSIEKALNSDFRDFEDAIQYYSALATQCDVIITRNEKDFKQALIPVMDAEGFLKLGTRDSYRLRRSRK